jgi:hypothetical protein
MSHDEADRTGAPHGSQHLGVPLEGGHSDALVRERASATPRQSSAAPARAFDTAGRTRAKTAILAHLDVPLHALQHWFASAVMHPDGVARGIGAAPAGPGGILSLDEVERVILPSRHLAGIDRLAIYGDAYRARLVECLADDYPALKYALGDEPFEALCLRYIARHPSESPNLNFFGRHMAAFCRTEAARAPSADPDGPPLAFAVDLAALEWALVEVLHAPSAEKLDLATLGTIPVTAWASACFLPSGTVRVLTFDYPVNDYFQAFRTEQSPVIPGASWSATAAFRDGTTIWRMNLSRAMHGLLTALSGGTPLGPALDMLAHAGTISEDEGAEVMVWFRDWVRHGFFSSIETG